MSATRKLAAPLVFLLVASAMADHTRAGSAAPATSRPTDVATLRQERIDALAKASNAARQLYLQGLADYLTLSHLDDLLADARVDAAQTSSDRLAALRANRDVAARDEELAQSRFKADKVTEIDVHLARADVLLAEIRLAEAAAN